MLEEDAKKTPVVASAFISALQLGNFKGEMKTKQQGVCGENCGGDKDEFLTYI